VRATIEVKRCFLELSFEAIDRPDISGGGDGGRVDTSHAVALQLRVVRTVVGLVECDLFYINIIYLLSKAGSLRIRHKSLKLLCFRTTALAVRGHLGSGLITKR